MDAVWFYFPLSIIIPYPLGFRCMKDMASEMVSFHMKSICECRLFMKHTNNNLRLLWILKSGINFVINPKEVSSDCLSFEMSLSLCHFLSLWKTTKSKWPIKIKGKDIHFFKLFKIIYQYFFFQDATAFYGMGTLQLSRILNWNLHELILILSSLGAYQKTLIV